ncbi:hypothetical protein LTR62_000272 [Meristemomyces frigidus]|uniref:Secreted protein n=1 Tax=Meristemomyces frigidus TaxID=1508187 RepID=A0AAN7TXR3_9PEZI|nr:hypothetical protein LTR62_000272 [Meristemomyces frigidus]
MKTSIVAALCALALTATALPVAQMTDCWQPEDNGHGNGGRGWGNLPPPWFRGLPSAAASSAGSGPTDGTTPPPAPKICLPPPGVMSATGWRR